MATNKPKLAPASAQGNEDQVVSAEAADVPVGEPDPFDPETLRLDPNSELVGIKKLVAAMPVRRPKKQEFFRVRPEPAFRLDVAVLDLEEDGDVYMVAPALRDELADELKRTTLYLAQSRSGSFFLIPIRLPDSSGRRNSWTDSQRRGVETAMHSWTRLMSNRTAGQYDIAVATGTFPEPEWPEMTMRDILRLAFKDAMIDSIDHPAVRRLRGLA